MKNATMSVEIKERAVYSLSEAAELLKVSRSTVLKLVQKKKLPAARIGKQYRILGYYILDYVLSQTAPKAKAKAFQADREWSKRLESITAGIGARTAGYEPEEIEKDITEAIKEVKTRRGRRSA